MNPLSPVEVNDLARHEAVIERGLTSFFDVVTALTAIRDGRLYRATFSTFETYCRERWGFTRQHANRLIAASEVMEDLEPRGSKNIPSYPNNQPEDLEPRGSKNTPSCPILPDKPSQVRALTALPRSERAEAWQEAQANGKPTVKTVQAVVNRRLGKPPSASLRSDPTPVESAPIPGGQSRVNGVLMADPPQIAAKRAAGIIDPDVVVEITEPDSAPSCEEPDADADDDATLSDPEWLKTLPVREHLSATRIAGFDADALEYRKLESHRKTFQHHASRTLAKHSKGQYAYLTRRFLKTNHPRHWLVCPLPENGGCDGSGELIAVGTCPKCRGRGYYIP